MSNKYKIQLFQGKIPRGLKPYKQYKQLQKASEMRGGVIPGKSTPISCPAPMSQP